MKNTLKNPTALAPGQNAVFCGSARDFLALFAKDYDLSRPLGTEIINRKFPGGVEARVKIESFPNLAFIRLSFATTPPATPFTKMMEIMGHEVSPWVQELSIAAARVSGINLATAGTASDNRNTILLFEPKPYCRPKGEQR